MSIRRRGRRSRHIQSPIRSLRFQRLDERARLPQRAHRHDGGLDLYACDSGTIEPRQRLSVPTGVAVEIPPYYAGLITPRSGLAARNGVSVVNTPGLIDSGYRGELRVLLLNTDNRLRFHFDAGDRIAQLLLVPIATPSAVWAELSDSGDGRGDGGFGSSGS